MKEIEIYSFPAQPVPRKWSEAEKDMRCIQRELLNLLLKRYGDFNIYLKIRGKILTLLNQCGLSKIDLRKTVAYHLFIGSTPVYDYCEVFDLPGNLSIRKNLVKWINLVKSKLPISS